MIRVTRRCGSTGVWGALAAAALGGAGCVPPTLATAQTSITQESVDAHIRYLSSDELRGRDAFSPDIQLAEN
jgi:hypothetical protein